MNKEFKKLLEASYTKGFEECARTGHKVGDLDVIFNSIVMGEFAELIVRECAACCGSQADKKNIRRHFGLPVESDVKYPGPDAHWSVTSQYTREYNIPDNK